MDRFAATPAMLRWSSLLIVMLGLLGFGGCRASEVAATGQPVLQAETEEDLRELLDEVLNHTYRHRHLNTKDHAAWQILHGVLTYKRQFMIAHADGQLVSAVEYLLDGGEMEGFVLEPVIDQQTGHRGIRSLLEKGSKTGQGHYDQWLAILAQSEVGPQETIKVQGQTLTMADYVAQVQWDLPRNVDREYSWTLIGLTTYLPTDAAWTAQDGRTWTIPQLVEVEAEYPIGEGACGGTHRLIGLAMALNRHLAQGGQLVGPWKQAEQRIQEAIALAKSQQNADGSFSTNYFGRRAHSPDLSARLATTGHIVEFLTLATTDQQLREPWIRDAVIHLCDILRKAKDLPLECGALYHATHGLLLYRERLYGPLTFSPSDVTPPGPTTAPAATNDGGSAAAVPSSEDNSL